MDKIHTVRAVSTAADTVTAVIITVAIVMAIITVAITDSINPRSVSKRRGDSLTNSPSVR